MTSSFTYAKLVIAPSAGESGNYRFVMDRYKRLKNGEIRMSEHDREIQKLPQQPGVCVFCGRRFKTAPTEVVSRRLGGPVGIHNLLHACAPHALNQRTIKTFWTGGAMFWGRTKTICPGSLLACFQN